MGAYRTVVNPLSRCFCILLPALIGMIAPAAWGQQFYASDALGLRGEAISSSQLNEYQYVLEVITEPEPPADAEQLLYKDGELIERRILYRDAAGATEEFYVSGALDRIEKRDRNGRLVAEELYTDGQLSERREYRYSSTTPVRLLEREIVSPDGTTITAEQYAYWRDGSLRRVERQTQSGYLQLSYQEGRLVRSVRVTDETEELIEYDAAGRLVKRIVREDDALVEQEDRTYWGQRSDAAVRTVTIDRSGELVVRSYDETGALVSTDTGSGETVQRQSEREYRDGLLVREREVIDGVARVTTYQYDMDDTLTAAETTEDGQLVLVVEYPTEGDITRAETIYRSGEPLLRVSYIGETRVRETEFRDGEAVRTREFGTPEEQE